MYAYPPIRTTMYYFARPPDQVEAVFMLRVLAGPGTTAPQYYYPTHRLWARIPEHPYLSGTAVIPLCTAIGMATECPKPRGFH